LDYPNGGIIQQGEIKRDCAAHMPVPVVAKERQEQDSKLALYFLWQFQAQ
jgi:hypothetical protein